MKKVTKLKDNKYLSTETIVHGIKKLNILLDNLLHRTELNMITYALNTNQIITTDNPIKIQLNTVLDKEGTKLLVSGNDIIIGAGVSKVKVSAIAWIESTAYKWLQIYKNTEKIQQAIFPKNSEETWGSVTIPSRTINVSEGDKISMWAVVLGEERKVEGETYGNNTTYLTVEVVK